MITLTSIREEFGVAKRITPSTFYSCLELGKGALHYFFHSVRGKLPDLVTVCSDAEDPEFAVWLLETVASRVDRSCDAPTKIGFSKSNTFGFDAVLTLPSTHHGHLKGVLNDKHATLVLCVPIHRCEFTGSETAEDFRQWQTRVGVECWKRKPCPYVAMEFQNPRRGCCSLMERTSIEACMTTLVALDGDTKAFAKVANYNGDIMLVEPIREGTYGIKVNTVKLDCSTEAMMEFVSAFVRNAAIPRAPI